MRLGRAIVVNPPNPSGYVSNKDSMGGFGQLYPAGAPPFPPLDVPYLAAFLAREGFPVEVVECNALGLETEGLVGALERGGARRKRSCSCAPRSRPSTGIWASAPSSAGVSRWAASGSSAPS